ncbi:hypothetical protein FD46_GL001701 [Liquorilactobacillus oeni DSM 19972]|uniref:TVP38/TMEM64 family membrane protein n=2 Tax=Liquorilactobacillus oeni TaxID=303241 RepID=A0A0R1M9I4_9LACO|nr:hypothetical protein FD46_GL001701 [Liquorilactobacillus oeni DSM 19972]
MVLTFIGYQLFNQYKPELVQLAHHQISKQALLHSVREHNLQAAVLLVILTALMSAFPGLPTSVICVFIGLCYGSFVGSVLNIIGNTAGNLLALTLLNKLEFLDEKTRENHWVKAISRMRHPRLGLMVAYMIPIIPSFLVNFTANKLRIKISHLCLVMFLGVMPSSILYALSGNSLFNGFNKRAVILWACVISFIVLIYFIHKDTRKKLAAE